MVPEDLSVRNRRSTRQPKRNSIAVGFLFLALVFTSAIAHAQNRVDLDDLNIKGELLNDNRLRLSARDPHKMAERVTYRENFRPEIDDHLEVPWPEAAAASKGGAGSDPKPASVDTAGGVGATVPGPSAGAAK